jgi:glycerophosphoryl diester phosphodiesterase
MMVDRHRWATLLSLAVACGSASAFDLQGHRGARGLAPENTIAAFKRALEIGVTTIETDVGITRDGVAVIAHDRRLNAALTRGPDGKWLTAAGPVIRSLSLAELKGYDVGRLDPASAYAKSWTQQVAVDGERIPALTELFDLVSTSSKPVRLNLETKLSPHAADETADAGSFARIVVEAVRKAGFASRTTLQSFDWRTLVEAKRLAPEIRTACLTTEGGNSDTVRPDDSGMSPWHAGLSLAKHEGSLPKLVKAAGCEIWSPFWRNATPERVREARALGLAVLPWTVNEPADMEMLIDVGVDGLITDYPDRLRRVLTAKGRPLP